jgi:hypothetical protein
VVIRLIRAWNETARWVWKRGSRSDYLALSAAVLPKLEQDLLGDRLERVEHSDSAIGDAFEHRFTFAAKLGG